MLELTDQTFNETIKSSDKIVIADFWAPWCGPCLKLSPLLEELSKEFTDTVVFAKINTDENMVTAREFDIMSIPSLLVFHNGVFQGKMNASGSVSALRERIASTVEVFK
jgi:thioredoxin 1